MATETLSGILRNNMTLSAGDTVKLTSDLQIAEGTTVTIEGGATLDLAGFEILNFGTVTLDGNDSNFAVLKNGTYSTSTHSQNRKGTFEANYGELIGVDFSFSLYGSLRLSNTVIQNSHIEAFQDTLINNSAFIDSSFDVHTMIIDVSKTTFLNSIVSVVGWGSSWGSTRGSSTFTEVNFVSSDQAIYLDPLFSGRMHELDISNSYINTDDPDSKIYDADDDLRVLKDINSDSFQETPITNSSDGFTIGSYTIGLDQLAIAPADNDPIGGKPGAVEGESNNTIDQHSLTVIANVFGEIMFLDDLTETVTESSHTIEYQGTSFDYAEVDSFIMTVVRDNEFTTEFATEIAESFPDNAGISYSTAVALIGQANMESTLMMVAGADGNYIG